MTYLQFLGGAGTVTGSKILVNSGETRLLVDCGMFQGAKKLRLLNWEPPPIPPNSVDHIFLTHAHIDHIGMLPRWVRDGFKGDVWATPPTRDLSEISLLDSAYLQEEDARFANKKGFSKHKPALPLYTTADAEKAIRKLRAIEYGEEVRIDGGTRVRLRDAGHILGSATVEATLGSNGTRTRIVFSGDLGRYGALLLKDPAPVEGTDYLVVESTYGDRLHPVEETFDEVAEAINETAARGGTLVIPAFAIGRTQTILYVIRELKALERIPDLPVYVDSPMAIKVTDLFCDHIDAFDEAAQAVYRETGKCPILCPNIHFTAKTEESKRLNETRFPSIIISASGMATGGRVLHHMKVRLPDSRNTILFVGFQSNGTRGQYLRDGAEQIKIHGEMIPVRAQIRTMESFSRHADSGEILRWLGTVKTPPRKTFVVHGEPSSSRALAEKIGAALGWETYIPEYMEKCELG